MYFVPLEALVSALDSFAHESATLVVLADRSQTICCTRLSAAGPHDQSAGLHAAHNPIPLGYATLPPTPSPKAARVLLDLLSRMYSPTGDGAREADGAGGASRDGAGS